MYTYVHTITVFFFLLFSKSLYSMGYLLIFKSLILNQFDVVRMIDKKEKRASIFTKDIVLKGI